MEDKFRKPRPPRVATGKLASPSSSWGLGFGQQGLGALEYVEGGLVSPQEKGAKTAKPPGFKMFGHVHYKKMSGLSVRPSCPLPSVESGQSLSAPYVLHGAFASTQPKAAFLKGFP